MWTERSGGARSRYTPRIPMVLPSGPRSTKRKPPPTLKSTSQTASDHPRGPNHCFRSSGLENASKTRWRGASKTRVITISRSVGVVTFNVPVFFIGNLLSLFSCAFLLSGFHFIEQDIQAFEAAFPEL